QPTSIDPLGITLTATPTPLRLSNPAPDGIDHLVRLLDQVKPVHHRSACGNASRTAFAYTDDISIATSVICAFHASSRASNQSTSTAEVRPLTCASNP